LSNRDYSSVLNESSCLDQENKILKTILDFQRSLVHIAAGGGGFEGILKALERHFHFPVAVFDNLLVSFAGYPEDTDSQFTELFFKNPEIKHLAVVGRVKCLETAVGEHLLVAPIFGSERHFGYLCGLLKNRNLTEWEKSLFDYAAEVLVMEWIKDEAIRESQERLKGIFFEEVLSGEMNVRLVQQARLLGLDVDDYYLVMQIREVNHAGKLSIIPPTAVKIERLLRQIGSGGLLLPYHKRLIAIIHLPVNSTKGERQKLIRALINKLNEEKNMQIGLGRLFKGLSSVEKSYKDAQQCMQLFDVHSPCKPVIYFGDLGAVRFFLQHDKEELENYFYELLGPLMDYDEEKNTQLLHTLLVYIRHKGIIKEITDELNVHYNTLYYRLNRIQKIIGCTFGDDKDWFAVKLACEIYNFLGPDFLKKKERYLC